ncbi:MAG: trypsin-like peptidase domain-containing protein [Chitinophagaceae bacterium]|nr:trypsin-like peptidase domain-containing protein [Oligoflexus sp.]
MSESKTLSSSEVKASVPSSTDTPPQTGLEAISKGVSAISMAASKGVVLVSTSKEIEDRNYGRTDALGFFFGPGPGRRPQVQAPITQRQEGLGSGFIIDEAQGYIVTNNHVVENASEITVKLANGHTYDAQVVGRDQRTDVAVIKIKASDFAREGIHLLAFADSSKVATGEFAIGLGAPFGLIKNGKVDRAYLGVELQQLQPGITLALGLPHESQGALVAKVQKNSPADEFGIEAGDIITSVNGSQIHSEHDVMNTITKHERFSRHTVFFTSELHLNGLPAASGKVPKRSQPRCGKCRRQQGRRERRSRG